MLCLYLFLPSAGRAESKWTVEVCGGGRSTRSIEGPTNSGLSLRTPNEYESGIGVAYTLSEVVSIRAGMEYAHLSPRLIYDATLTETYRINYIDVPLAIQLSLPWGLITPYFVMGTGFSFKLAEAREWGPSITHTDIVAEDFSSYNLNLICGGGVACRLLSYLDIVIEGRYSLGLTEDYRLGNDFVDGMSYYSLTLGFVAKL